MEMSLEVIESERFKDGGVLTIRLLENIQECITMSKNILIYRKFGCNPSMERLIFDQRLWWNTETWIVTIKLWPLDLT